MQYTTTLATELKLLPSKHQKVRKTEEFPFDYFKPVFLKTGKVGIVSLLH